MIYGRVYDIHPFDIEKDRIDDMHTVACQSITVNSYRNFLRIRYMYHEKHFAINLQRDAMVIIILEIFETDLKIRLWKLQDIYRMHVEMVVKIFKHSIIRYINKS